MRNADFFQLCQAEIKTNTFAKMPKTLYILIEGHSKFKLIFPQNTTEYKSCESLTRKLQKADFCQRCKRNC